MSRYSIALNKTPREAEHDRLVTKFGFDQDIKETRKQTFFLKPGETTRVGIVFDDLSTFFYCAKIHYYKSHRFFCKSTSGHLAYCCQPEYSGRYPTLRIATIIARYSPPYDNLGHDNVKVVPWVFGKTVFNNLKTLNNTFTIDKHDFFLKSDSSDERAYRFKQYSIIAGPESLWQKSEMKPRIMEIHSQLKRTMRGYLAEDYSENDILNVISQPDRRELIGRSPSTLLTSTLTSPEWQAVNGGSGPRPVPPPEHMNEEDDFNDFFRRLQLPS